MAHIDMDLTVVQITLRSGRVDTYRGVFTVITESTLSVFTYDYLDPAEWRNQNHNDALIVVRAYSLAAVESWTEADHDGPPYVILPDSDHSLPSNRVDADGRPLGMEWRP